MITFITSVKICPKYEWLEQSLQRYIDCITFFCTKHDIDYEILIGEDLDHKNLRRVHLSGNVRVIDVPQIYPNPLGFNMIESYAKNACLSEARGTFVCMTSADQLFSEDLFIFIKRGLRTQTFYRFATYEVPHFDVASHSTAELIQKCNNTKTRLCNPGCFELPLTPMKLGQKSGDIMLLDTLSFKKIRGWPQNDCFTHVDTSVCFVAYNNFYIEVPPRNVCSYTFEQAYREPQQNTELYQWNRCLSYANKMTCN